MGFSREDLELLDRTGEVEIETRRGDRSYRTVIWVVVDEGEVFIRSVRGEGGKWYRRVQDNPEVTLHADSRAIDARVVPAHDEKSVSRVDEALRAKYQPGRSLDSMLREEVLDTTLRLEPA